MSDGALCQHKSFHGSMGLSNSSYPSPTGMVLLRVGKVEAKNTQILAFVGAILPGKPTMQGPVYVRYGFGLLNTFQGFHRTAQFFLA